MGKDQPSCDEREARATGDDRTRSARDHGKKKETFAFPSSLARPLIFQQRDVWVRGRENITKDRNHCPYREILPLQRKRIFRDRGH